MNIEQEKSGALEADDAAKRLNQEQGNTTDGFLGDLEEYDERVAEAKQNQTAAKTSNVHTENRKP